MNLQLHSRSEFENVYLPPNRERVYLHNPMMTAGNTIISNDRASSTLLKTFSEDQGFPLNYPNALLPDRFSGYPLSPNNYRGFLTYPHIGDLPPEVPSPLAEPRPDIPSPINIVTQRARKLAMKRERNRVAAQRCRKKKLEKIAGLEQKVKMSKKEIEEVKLEIHRLKNDVSSLKYRIKNHRDKGCVILGDGN